MAGAMKALQATGILDLTTYNVGLSGSSWYLSTLYNSKEMCTKQVNNEIKTRIENNKLKLLAPEKLRSYIKCLWEKHKRGQPVSFSDIFGCMIGEVLLGKSQMTHKLSSFRERIKDGKNPLPMMVAVIVKPHESAMRYHEWVEFRKVLITVDGAFNYDCVFGHFYIRHTTTTYFCQKSVHC